MYTDPIRLQTAIMCSMNSTLPDHLNEDVALSTIHELCIASFACAYIHVHSFGHMIHSL